MVINNANLAALFKGYRSIFLEALQGATPDYDKFAMTVPSSGSEEVYAWMGAVPGLREMVGEAVIQNVAEMDWTIRNREFESTVSVKRTSVERDAYGVYNPLFASLGLAARQHPDELFGDLLTGGFTQKDYTGKNFFDTAKKHEPLNSKSAVFTNKGTAALGADSYSVAKANIMGRKNAYGRSMKLGRNLLLIVGPTLEDTARKLLVADRDAAGATNIYQGSAQLLVFPELADSVNWFLIDNGYPVKPFIFQQEVAPELAAQDTNASDHVFLKKEYLYQAYARHNAGYGLPQLAYGSTGADE